jgi:hypothetical protein
MHILEAAMFDNLRNVPQSAMAGPEYAAGVRACARLFVAVALIAGIVGALNVAAGDDDPETPAAQVPTSAISVGMGGRR